MRVYHYLINVFVTGNGICNTVAGSGYWKPVIRYCHSGENKKSIIAIVVTLASLYANTELVVSDIDYS